MIKNIELEKGAYQFDAKMPLRQAIPLGLQHVFAMFVGNLTPLLIITSACGLAGGEFADLQVSLLQNAMFVAGVVTLVQLFSIGPVGGQVPIIMGTSSGFLGVFNSVAASMGGGVLAYGAIMGASIIGGIFESVLGFFLKPLRKFFPPVVTGPIIVAIGLGLAGSAVDNCKTNWPVALIALAIIIVFNVWGRGMAKIIPILLGVLGSYIFALIVDPAERASVAAAVSSAKWFGLPIFWKNSVFHLFAGPVDSGVLWSAVLTVVPLSLATMVEHIGDICAISSTCGKNFMVDPGFHRTLLGDGLATTLASLFGAPANTTYGENTGVLALSRVYDPRVIRLAALYAIILSFSPKFDALVNSIPTAIVGGVSFVLYGMISAVGVRNVVENRVDLTKSRNLIIAAVIFVCGLGFASTGGITFTVGSADITLTGLAIAALAGVILNAVLPGNDYEFGKSVEGDASADLGSY